MKTAAEEALQKLLSRLEGSADLETVDEVLLTISKDDLTLMGAHFIKSTLGFLLLVNKPKPGSDETPVM